MRIIEWSEFLTEALPLNGKPSAITIGVFDGLHRGHKALVERVVERKSHAVPVVVTFKQSHHKNAQYSGQEYSGGISSFRQKMSAFDSLGIGITIVIEFSDAFRRVSGADFLRTLRERAKMNFLAVGSNFRCGYQLDTDAPAIQDINARFDIPTAILPLLTEGSVAISSSQIRAAISRGELKAAQAMLGYPFTVDLGGAARSSSSPDGMAYDISGQGRILPPPGRYAVNLLDTTTKGEGARARKPVEIFVKDGNIIIDNNLMGENRCVEYVEFLP